MLRRNERSPDLKVRVSHEATRLSKAHVAAAFERLVPVLERQARSPRAGGDAHWVDSARRCPKPMWRG
jgi:hypothetical protein